MTEGNGVAYECSGWYPQFYIAFSCVVLFYFVSVRHGKWALEKHLGVWWVVVWMHYAGREVWSFQLTLRQAEPYMLRFAGQTQARCMANRRIPAPLVGASPAAGDGRRFRVALIGAVTPDFLLVHHLRVAPALE